MNCKWCNSNEDVELSRCLDCRLLQGNFDDKAFEEQIHKIVLNLTQPTLTALKNNFKIG